MTEGPPPAEGSRGAPVVWIVVFGVVFLGLVASVLVQISSDHLPARFVDVERSHLDATEAGTRLTLVLRHAPRHGQLHHDVIEPDEDGGPYVVEVSLAATGAPAPADSEDDRRTLIIDLPPVDLVRVVDLRWGREEAVEFRVGGPEAP